MTSARLCPICRKPRDHALKQRTRRGLEEPTGSAIESPHAPFCSTRCKDRDLVRWFSDSYAVPGQPADLLEDQEDIGRAEPD